MNEKTRLAYLLLAKRVCVPVAEPEVAILATRVGISDVEFASLMAERCIKVLANRLAEIGSNLQEAGHQALAALAQTLPNNVKEAAPVVFDALGIAIYTRQPVTLMQALNEASDEMEFALHGIANTDAERGLQWAAEALSAVAKSASAT